MFSTKCFFFGTIVFQKNFFFRKKHSIATAKSLLSALRKFSKVFWEWFLLQKKKLPYLLTQNPPSNSKQFTYPKKILTLNSVSNLPILVSSSIYSKTTGENVCKHHHFKNYSFQSGY